MMICLLGTIMVTPRNSACDQEGKKEGVVGGISSKATDLKRACGSNGHEKRKRAGGGALVQGHAAEQRLLNREPRREA